MKPELKPCPFCGGSAYLTRTGTHKQSTIVECGDCGCSLETGEVGGQCGTAWNRRVPAEPVKPHTKFDDPRAQKVYEIICGDNHPPKSEHWDGYVSRLIVDALFPDEPVRVPSDDEIEELAKQHLRAYAQFVGAGEVYYEGEVEFARALLAKYGNQSLSDTWKGVVEHELSALHLTTADFNSPSEAIKALIQWGINVATDPLVNGGFKLVPVKPTNKQICLMALEIQGVNDKGVCRTDDPRWPDSVAKAEAAYKAGVEASPEPEKK